MKKTMLPFLLMLIAYCSNCQSIDEILINSTLKIESVEKVIIKGKEKFIISSGTGFIFSFLFGNNLSLPVIITNKHVIKNSFKGVLYFKTKDSQGFPNYGKSEKLIIDNFKEQWVMHPDTSVDLAFCYLMPIISEYKTKKGIDLFYSSITEDAIPTDSLRKTINPIEEVIMIGYPYGLRDTINDLPIVRKGISATPIYLDYNLKKEFLVDLPVFFGSSGSPILIYNRGSWITRGSSDLNAGDRVLFVGINYATYTKNFDGKIIPKISNFFGDSLKIQTSIPLYNIGIIIKSERILEFKPLLKTRH